MCHVNRIISVSIGNRTSANKVKPQWVWTSFGALLGVGQNSKSGRKEEISGGQTALHCHVGVIVLLTRVKLYTGAPCLYVAYA